MKITILLLANILIYYGYTFSAKLTVFICVTDTNPDLGHLIEYIFLDLDAPAVCEYCDLRLVQDYHHSVLPVSGTW